jgi:hypothetical protein
MTLGYDSRCFESDLIVDIEGFACVDTECSNSDMDFPENEFESWCPYVVTDWSASIGTSGARLSTGQCTDDRSGHVVCDASGHVVSTNTCIAGETCYDSLYGNGNTLDGGVCESAEAETCESYNDQYNYCLDSFRLSACDPQYGIYRTLACPELDEDFICGSGTTVFSPSAYGYFCGDPDAGPIDGDLTAGAAYYDWGEHRTLGTPCTGGACNTPCVEDGVRVASDGQTICSEDLMSTDTCTEGVVESVSCGGVCEECQTMPLPEYVGDDCGDVDWDGACTADGVAQYCMSDELAEEIGGVAGLYALDCASGGYSCGFDETYGSVNCI